MTALKITHSLLLFLLAGLCEIAGGWLVWQWLREDKGISWGFVGGAVLILYGIIPTFQPAHFSRRALVRALQTCHPCLNWPFLMTSNAEFKIG